MVNEGKDMQVALILSLWLHAATFTFASANGANLLQLDDQCTAIDQAAPARTSSAASSIAPLICEYNL